jgi:hypothetical protein
MKYEVIKKEYVIETLGKGIDVIICDFETMKMLDCKGLIIDSIRYYIEKPNTVFYKAVVNE